MRIKVAVFIEGAYRQGQSQPCNNARASSVHLDASRSRSIAGRPFRAQERQRMRSKQGQTDEEGVCLLFIEPLLIFGRVCIRGERVEHEERQHVDPGPNGQRVQQLQGPNLVALDAQRHDGAGTSCFPGNYCRSCLRVAK